MKQLILWIMAIGAMPCGTLFAQNISGTWQGTLHSGRDLRMVLKISKGDGGSLKAMYYNIDQPGPGIAVSSISLQGSTMKFAIAAIGGAYEGKLANTDGSATMKGSWRQDDTAPIPLDLVLANDATAWDIPEPPPLPQAMAGDAQLQFEVAIIKPSQGRGFGTFTMSPGGTLNVANMPLMTLMQICYDIHPRQIAGGPSWLETDKFDITAKPDTAGYPDMKQLKEMVQKLLVERFHLTFHYEKKEISVYALTVAKGGPKLTEDTNNPNGRPGFRGGGPSGANVQNATMAEFASFLQGSALEEPVVDQTGLGPKKYDFVLKWTPDGPAANPGTAAPLAVHNSDEPPDIYGAIQQQLGLKIESKKALMDVMVIDRVEKPSEN